MDFAHFQPQNGNIHMKFSIKKSTSESVLTVVAGPNYIDLIFLTFRLKFNYRKRTFRQKLLIKKNKGPYHRKAMAMLKYMGKTTSTTEINTQ